MKRAISFTLALILCLALIVPAVPARAAAPRPYTVQLPVGWWDDPPMRYNGFNPGEPKHCPVTVTYTGFIGFYSLPKYTVEPIMLLEEGSEIHIKLTPDPGGKHDDWFEYNTLFQNRRIEQNAVKYGEITAYGAYLGGYGSYYHTKNYAGFIYVRQPGWAGNWSAVTQTQQSIRDFDGFQLSVFGRESGPPTFEVYYYDGPYFKMTAEEREQYGGNLYYKPQGFYGTEWARQVGPYEYVINVQNGLFDYSLPFYSGIIDWGMDTRLRVGMALSVSSEQLKERRDTGTMTFHKGTDLEYQYDYPGIEYVMDIDAAIEDADVTYTGPKPEFFGAHLYDNGFVLEKGRIANPTDEQLNGRWGVITLAPDGGMNWGVMRYYLAPHGSFDNLSLYVAHSGFGAFWQDAVNWTDIPEGYKIVYVDLNAESDYQEFMNLSEELLNDDGGRYGANNFDREEGNSRYYAAYLGSNTSDVEANRQWLAANFPGLF